MTIGTAAAPSWRSNAACKDADPILFFPEGEDWQLRAKQTARDWCSTCSTRLDCLAWAYQQGIPFGVWGGKVFGIRSWREG